MKVLLGKGVWIADWEGDPGRTVKEENAKEFDSMAEAMLAISRARKYRPFPNAQVTEDLF